MTMRIEDSELRLAGGGANYTSFGHGILIAVCS